MQPLIHQASLHRLSLAIGGSGIVPGQNVDLEVTAEREICVYALLPSRLPFGLGRPHRHCVGFLQPEATKLLLSALDGNARLRVRIVEVEPAHARADGVDSVSISVWGDPDDFGAYAKNLREFARAQAGNGRG